MGILQPFFVFLVDVCVGNPRAIIYEQEEGVDDNRQLECNLTLQLPENLTHFVWHRVYCYQNLPLSVC